MACTAAESEALEVVAIAYVCDDVGGIVRALQRFPLCAEVQTRGCDALTELAKSGPDAILRADGAAAMEVALQALRLHVASVRVQRAALKFMTVLLRSGSAAARGHLMTLDAFIPVMDALRGAFDAERVGLGCLVLGYLAIDESIRAKALDAGVLELLIPALIVQDLNTTALCAVLFLLDKLASHSKAAMQRAVDANVFVALNARMRACADDAALQQASCKFIDGLGMTNAQAECAGAAGVVEVLVAALESDQVLTQQRGCEALHGIVCRSRSSAHRAVQAGVLEPLLQFLSTRTIPADAAGRACGVLHHLLLDNPAASQHACRLGAVEIIIAAGHAHQHERAAFVPGWSSGALHSMLLHGAPDAIDRARRAGALPLLQAALNNDNKQKYKLRECLSIFQDADVARCAAADAAMAALLAEEEAERSAKGAAAKSKGKSKSKSKKSKSKSKGGGGGASGSKPTVNDDNDADADADADAADLAPQPAPPAAPLDDDTDRVDARVDADAALPA
jgi:hypothetical protein